MVAGDDAGCADGEVARRIGAVARSGIGLWNGAAAGLGIESEVGSGVAVCRGCYGRWSSALRDGHGPTLISPDEVTRSDVLHPQPNSKSEARAAEIIGPPGSVKKRDFFARSATWMCRQAVMPRNPRRGTQARAAVRGAGRTNDRSNPRKPLRLIPSRYPNNSAAARAIANSSSARTASRFTRDSFVLIVAIG